jgi:hypothetical protein
LSPIETVIGITRGKFLVEKSKEKLYDIEQTVARYAATIPETRAELNALKESLPPEPVKAEENPSDAVAGEKAVSDSDAAHEGEVITETSGGSTTSNTDVEAPAVKAGESNLEQKLAHYFSGNDSVRLQSVIAAIVLHSGERGVEDFINDCKEVPFDIAAGPGVEDTDALLLAMDMQSYYDSFPFVSDTTGSGEGVISRLDAASSGLVTEKVNQMVFHLALQRYNAETLLRLLPKALSRALIFSGEYANYGLASVGVNPQQSKNLMELARKHQTAEEESSRRETIQAKIRELEQKLSSDVHAQTEAENYLTFAKNDEYGLLALHDYCFDTQVREYKYTVCTFKEAHQNSVSLGKYSGMEELLTRDEHGNVIDRTIRLYFKNGDVCHAVTNQPARSISVDLVCSNVGVNTDNGQSLVPESIARLTEIIEPEACSYTAELHTSLACH